MPNRYFSEEMGLFAICKWNWIMGTFETRAIHWLQLSKNCRVYKLCSRSCWHASVHEGVLRMVLHRAFFTLGLRFWSSKHTSSCHSVQVFVLTIWWFFFFLLKSRNRSWPSWHVFDIPPAFTSVIFSTIVSLSVFVEELSFLLCIHN